MKKDSPGQNTIYLIKKRRGFSMMQVREFAVQVS
jgi:hypothetical protein